MQLLPGKSLAAEDRACLGEASQSLVTDTLEDSSALSPTRYGLCAASAESVSEEVQHTFVPFEIVKLAPAQQC